MTKQSIYLINKKLILSAFYEAAGKYTGLSFAKSQHHHVLADLNRIIGDQEFIALGLICDALNAHKTDKLIGNANAGVTLMIKRINENKVTKEKD